MTFYQELQLNQAGSKSLIKNCKTPKEKAPVRRWTHGCFLRWILNLFMLFCNCRWTAAKGAVCRCRWSRSFSGNAPEEGETFLLPLTQTRKGGCSMTLSEVLQLLAVIGGAVFVTFQITWTISNGKKKWPPKAFQASGHSFWLSRGGADHCGQRLFYL